MPVADTFKALGDPVRLEMVQRLSDGAPRTVSNLLGGLDISRQGARKHLQVLADAELVTLKPHGRQVEVSLDLSSLASARAFIAGLEQQWGRRLDKLKTFIEGDHADQ